MTTQDWEVSRGTAFAKNGIDVLRNGVISLRIDAFSQGIIICCIPLRLLESAHKLGV
jgi:hypothetical protein